MKGYRLTAISPKGEQTMKDRGLNKKDKKAVISVISEKPYAISVLFTDRILKFVAKEDVIKLNLMRELPFCQEGRDYEVRFIE